jgi:hypothetical protein
MSDPADAQLVRGPQQRQASTDDHALEPHRLVIRRVDRKVERRAFLVPHAAVVGGEDAEVVWAWREIRVFHMAVADHLAPVAVLPIQP